MWDAEQVRKAVEISGKPLEIQCASLFMKRGWNALLGSYFVDSASDKIRELDVLASNHLPVLNADRRIEVSLRVLAS
jgi:hypothetical protein